MAVEVREYVDARGRSPYARWFNRLGGTAAAKVAMAVIRLEQGNFSNIRGVGGGVHERKIDYGPGYRVYFGRDGAELIILLGGGTKATQRADIRRAGELWKDYKRRKKAGS